MCTRAIKVESARYGASTVHRSFSNFQITVPSTTTFLNRLEHENETLLKHESICGDTHSGYWTRWNPRTDSLVRKGETEKSTPFFGHNTTEKTAIFAPEIFIESVFTFINSF